jgi:mRNA interferase MazF
MPDDRYAVVVQSDLLPLSTWLVAPTSTSARAATFRPEVFIAGRATRVLAEQTTAVDPQRLGDPAGRLTFEELRRVDAALRPVLSLRPTVDAAPIRPDGTLLGGTHVVIHRARHPDVPRLSADEWPTGRLVGLSQQSCNRAMWRQSSLSASDRVSQSS